MGQGASLARVIANDVREMMASTNKEAYMKQYNAYKEASSRLEAARVKNAALQQNLEMTKANVYMQADLFRQQKEKLDYQIEEYANMHAIDSEFFDKHKRVAEHMKQHAANVAKEAPLPSPPTNTESDGDDVTKKTAPPTSTSS
ncbi:hypothetical protein H310_04654 [Aphanomyces invadans]|uniref:Uncharacterized protein n=1 Tax=Aphanomyces invadans TaxID=157072 RepID=A0A024UER3_9STRA|nr:hypothetical protein H310_04654 [Aphanomyces invadans]ETW04362.1 hypothetical protein H310_04654 [Aphanomyces invadans]|eukprot:XP_008867318.1 hypothetical protein H310_04654 [Aphanomyces invadans]